MRAAMHATDFLSDCLAPPSAHLDANQGLVVGRDGGTHCKRTIVCSGDNIMNGEAVINGNAQQHFV